MNSVCKKYQIDKCSGLVEARVNNIEESYDSQLNRFFGMKWKGTQEIHMALTAYMTISCFYTAYDHAQKQKLFTNGGIFDYDNSKLDFSESGSEAGSAPRNGR